MKNLEALCVQKLETVTFERQRQYSSLFSRLEADQCKFCELQRSLALNGLMSTLMST